MAARHTSDTAFQYDVLTADKPVLVDFWAEWCGPCRMIGPSLDELSDELGEKVDIVKLNIDEHPEAAARYNVRSIPMMVLFKDGQQVSTKLGAAPKSQIRDWLVGELA